MAKEAVKSAVQDFFKIFEEEASSMVGNPTLHPSLTVFFSRMRDAAKEAHEELADISEKIHMLNLELRKIRESME